MNRTLPAAACTMLAFAANSILCRMALRQTAIDPASFTSIRLISGAVVLWLLVVLRQRRPPAGGNWLSALALLAYAAAFSYAYVGVTAGTGALLLFGAVQLIMIASGLISGERIVRRIAVGWVLAVAGVVFLVFPGVSAPPLLDASLMLAAGIAWGIYSLRGQRSKNPLDDTAGNFVRAVPGVLVLSLLLWRHAVFDTEGAALAAISGAITSGLGYAIWYSVLPRLSAIAAANAQLSVPVIASLGGVVLFGESVTLRLAVATFLVLGGIALARHDKA